MSRAASLEKRIQPMRDPITADSASTSTTGQTLPSAPFSRS